jgi:hypothetical protein
MQSFYVYSIPGTNIFVDNGYNLCDYEGVLYESDGYTIPFEEYIAGNANLRRRQYPEVPPPPTGVLYWKDMDECWDNGRIGIKGNYAYVQSPQGFAIGANQGNIILFCELGFMRNRRRQIQTPSGERFAMTNAIGKQRINGVQSNPFQFQRPFPALRCV